MHSTCISSKLSLLCRPSSLMLETHFDSAGHFIVRERQVDFQHYDTYFYWQSGVTTLEGHDKANPVVFWLATKTRKIVLSCLLGISRKKKNAFDNIINLSLTKFVKSRWLDIGWLCFLFDSFYFSVFEGKYGLAKTVSHLDLTSLKTRHVMGTKMTNRIMFSFVNMINKGNKYFITTTDP